LLWLRIQRQRFELRIRFRFWDEFGFRLRIKLWIGFGIRVKFGKQFRLLRLRIYGRQFKLRIRFRNRFGIKFGIGQWFFRRLDDESIGITSAGEGNEPLGKSECKWLGYDCRDRSADKQH
jgi:hypothetical protein